MKANVFLHRDDTKLIDTVYLYRLDDFPRLKRATGWAGFLVDSIKSLLDLAKTALAKANMVDK